MLANQGTEIDLVHEPSPRGSTELDDIAAEKQNVTADVPQCGATSDQFSTDTDCRMPAVDEKIHRSRKRKRENSAEQSYEVNETRRKSHNNQENIFLQISMEEGDAKKRGKKKSIGQNTKQQTAHFSFKVVPIEREEPDAKLSEMIQPSGDKGFLSGNLKLVNESSFHNLHGHICYDIYKEKIIVSPLWSLEYKKLVKENGSKQLNPILDEKSRYDDNQLMSGLYGKRRRGKQFELYWNPPIDGLLSLAKRLGLYKDETSKVDYSDEKAAAILSRLMQDNDKKNSSIMSNNDTPMDCSIVISNLVSHRNRDWKEIINQGLMMIKMLNVPESGDIDSSGDNLIGREKINDKQDNSNKIVVEKTHVVEDNNEKEGIKDEKMIDVDIQETNKADMRENDDGNNYGKTPRQEQPVTVQIDEVCRILDGEEIKELLIAMERLDPYSTCYYDKKTGKDVDEKFKLVAAALALKRNGMEMEFEIKKSEQLESTSPTSIVLCFEPRQLKLLKSQIGSGNNRSASKQLLDEASEYYANNNEPENTKSAGVRLEENASDMRRRRLRLDSNNESISNQGRKTREEKQRIKKEKKEDNGGFYCRRAGRPKVNRMGCKCLLCNTLQTPQWRFMTLFDDDEWMDLVCNACYMKFNGCRPHYLRPGKSPPAPPGLSNIKKPHRPTLEEHKIRGPAAWPHLMRRNDSKQNANIGEVDEQKLSNNKSCRKQEGNNKERNDQEENNKEGSNKEGNNKEGNNKEGQKFVCEHRTPNRISSTSDAWTKDKNSFSNLQSLGIRKSINPMMEPIMRNYQAAYYQSIMNPWVTRPNQQQIYNYGFATIKSDRINHEESNNESISTTSSLSSLPAIVIGYEEGTKAVQIGAPVK